MLIGGIEAGGTKIVCGAAEVTEEGIHILDRMRFATGRPEEAVRKAADYFKDFPIKALGVACFGPLDLRKDSATYGHIMATPKKGWEHFDLLGPFEKEIGVPAVLDTDVNVLLRKLGIGPDRCRILTWVYNGTEVPFDELIAADIDVSVGSLPGIDAVAAAARKLGKPARVHVKVDSGFGRNGFTPAGFDAALAKLVPLAKEGVLHIVGQWSHLAVADSPDVSEFVSSTDRQIETFKDFTRRMEQAGIPPEIRHLANTAATLDRPEIHFELTRPGIGLYGYEPDPAMGTPRDWHLTPAMRLQAQLGTVKDVEAGHGISYGRTYLTPDNTSTAIVPLGYADGIHRSASGFDMEGAKHVEKPGGPVRIMTTEGPKIYRVCGRVCMDQFIVDLHGSAAELGVHEGDTVELFGPGRGEDYVEPTADDWARAADTISYEIFTCLRNRIPRLYEHAAEVLPAADLAKLDPATLL